MTVSLARQQREKSRLARIGQAIRLGRQHRSMTLEVLAATVGLSVTFLSRLERGHVACSIGNLLEIADALGLTPAEILEDAQAGERNKSFRVVRAVEAIPEFRADGSPYGWSRLASGIDDQRIETFLLELPAGHEDTAMASHRGEEMCFVLEGSVEFRIGEDRVSLTTGDSIHLRSDIPHMAFAQGPGPSRLLMVTVLEGRGATSVEWWTEAISARQKSTARMASKAAELGRRRSK